MRAVAELPGLVDADARLVHRGRFLTTTFLLAIGDDSYLVRVDQGRVAEVRTGPFVGPSWNFALRASAETWHAFWSPAPSAGEHDLLALVRRERLQLEGDLHPFMANLLYFKDVLVKLRDLDR